MRKRRSKKTERKRRDSLSFAAGIRYTENDSIVWIKQFCSGDPCDELFRRRIIDVFVNSIYLYDDKVVVYYNIKGGKQISCMEMCDSLDDNGALENLTRHDGVRISNNLAEEVGFEPTDGSSPSLDFEEGECQKSQAYRGVLACRFGVPVPIWQKIHRGSV